MAIVHENQEAGMIGKSPLPWPVVRTIAVGALLVAAMTKATFATEILASEGLLSTSWRLFPAIGGEAAVALLLVVLRPRVSRLFCLVTFLLLAGVSGYATLTQQSCQCFGSSIPSHYMLIFDLAMVALTMASSPGTGHSPAVSPSQADVTISTAGSQTYSMRSALVGSAVLGLTVSCGAFAFHAMSVPSSVEFLLPETLQGQAWPITSRHHPDLTQLQTGKWLAVVLRPDCEHCQQLVETWFADPTRHRSGERTVMFHATDRHWSLQFDRVTLSEVAAAERPSIHWASDPPFVAAPGVFVLDNGIVVDGADGSEADAFLTKLFATELE